MNKAPNSASVVRSVSEYGVQHHRHRVKDVATYPISTDELSREPFSGKALRDPKRFESLCPRIRKVDEPDGFLQRLRVPLNQESGHHRQETCALHRLDVGMRDT